MIVSDNNKSVARTRRDWRSSRMVREMIVLAAGMDGFEALLTHTDRMLKDIGSVREVGRVGGLVVGC